jgi:hypothetical protein
LILWKVAFLLFLLPCHLMFCEMKWNDGDQRKLVMCMSKVACEDVTNEAMNAMKICVVKIQNLQQCTVLFTRNCVKHWQKCSEDPTHEQKDSELHMKRTTTSCYKELWPLRSFVVNAKIGACLFYSEVVDDGWNEIMAMRTRVKSSFLTMGTKLCTNVSMKCWHGWQ